MARAIAPPDPPSPIIIDITGSLTFKLTAYEDAIENYLIALNIDHQNILAINNLIAALTHVSPHKNHPIIHANNKLKEINKLPRRDQAKVKLAMTQLEEAEKSGSRLNAARESLKTQRDGIVAIVVRKIYVLCHVLYYVSYL